MPTSDSSKMAAKRQSRSDLYSEYSRPKYRRHSKPPYTYTALIAASLWTAPYHRRTLQGIQRTICDMFPFFAGSYQGWRDSIRHNLSYTSCFVKVLRDPSKPNGKCNEWTVSWGALPSDTFLRQAGDNEAGYNGNLLVHLGLATEQEINGEYTETRLKPACQQGEYTETEPRLTPDCQQGTRGDFTETERGLKPNCQKVQGTSGSIAVQEKPLQSDCISTQGTSLDTNYLRMDKDVKHIEQANKLNIKRGRNNVKVTEYPVEVKVERGRKEEQLGQVKVMQALPKVKVEQSQVKGTACPMKVKGEQGFLEGHSGQFKVTHSPLKVRLEEESPGGHMDQPLKGTLPSGTGRVRPENPQLHATIHQCVPSSAVEPHTASPSEMSASLMVDKELECLIDLLGGDNTEETGCDLNNSGFLLPDCILTDIDTEHGRNLGAAMDVSVEGMDNTYPSNQELVHTYPSNQELVHTYPSNQELVNSYPSNQELVNTYPSNQELVNTYPSDQELSEKCQRVVYAAALSLGLLASDPVTSQLQDKPLVSNYQNNSALSHHQGHPALSSCQGNPTLSLPQDNSALSCCQGNPASSCCQGNPALSCCQGNPALLCCQGNPVLPHLQGNPALLCCQGNPVLPHLQGNPVLFYCQDNPVVSNHQGHTVISHHSALADRDMTFKVVETTGVAGQTSCVGLHPPDLDWNQNDCKEGDSFISPMLQTSSQNKDWQVVTDKPGSLP